MAGSGARLIVLDKLSGATSFDMVREVRRITGQRRVGHGGTLDPFATGVLLVAVGRATRLLTFLTAGSKRYRLTVHFGRATHSHDRTGRETAVGVPRFDEPQLRAALTSFVGEISQRPPAVSALKVGGERAYRLLERGELTEDLPPRPVRIDSIELLSFELPRAELRVACGGGTYMRALARDLGEALDCPAHAASLTREAVGAFELEEAVSVEDLARDWPEGRGILDPAAVARFWPRHALTAEQRVRVCHGGPVEGADESLDETQPVGLMGPDGQLVAVARRVEDRLQPTVVLEEA